MCVGGGPSNLEGESRGEVRRRGKGSWCDCGTIVWVGAATGKALRSSGLWDSKTLLQCHPGNPGTQLIQLLQPNPFKTKLADDPKSSGHPADPNPLLDALSPDTFHWFPSRPLSLVLTLSLV